jgi:hypothetical protein
MKNHRDGFLVARHPVFFYQKNSKMKEHGFCQIEASFNKNAIEIGINREFEC